MGIFYSKLYESEFIMNLTNNELQILNHHGKKIRKYFDEISNQLICLKHSNLLKEFNGSLEIHFDELKEFEDYLLNQSEIKK